MLRQRIWAYIHSISSFIIKYKKFVSIAGLLGVIGIFQALGIWSSIISGLSSSFTILSTFVSPTWSAPRFVWIIALFSILALFYFVLKNSLYLGKVAGEFFDDFKTGLTNWDYEGDWKIEEEDGKRILSVSNSPIGGFTKKGFNWTDYEFSFETKVIKTASGWIIRANANDYFMVQLYLEGNSAYEYKLRPHYHKLQGGTEIWLPDDKNSVDLSKIELEREIKLLQWIKVKIVVEGNQVDIYLDEKHALHYLISTVGVSVNRTFIFKDNKSGNEFEATTNEIVPLGSNAAGRVGFRESKSGGEHAHFRKVSVKPL